ncbi:MAG: alkyl hydroperoxide reductase, partial [Rivularia sp. (in: cyanobacteria)]
NYGVGQALGAPLPGQFILDKQGKLIYKHLFSFLDHNASVETLLSYIDLNLGNRE